MIALYIGEDNEENATPFLNQSLKDQTEFEIIFEPNLNNAFEIITLRKIDLLFICIDNIKETYESIKHFREKVRNFKEKVIFIAITNDKSNCYEAIKLNFHDVLLSPISQENLYRFLLNFNEKYPKHKVFIQTIPEFCLYIDEVILPFNNKKAKEILALLVDAEGSPVNNNTIIDTIWPNSPCDDIAKSRCRVEMHNLRTILQQHGISFILSDTGRQRYVNSETFDCDLYELLSGNLYYIQRYNHRYMESYSWAETTKGKIQSYLQSIKQYRPPTI